MNEPRPILTHNRATGLTANSILDIFSMARVANVAITVEWDADINEYCVTMRDGNVQIVQYISADKFDVAKSDVSLAYFILHKMVESMKEV